MGIKQKVYPMIGVPWQHENFTYGGGAWDADYPVTMAQNLTYAKPALSTDLNAASLQITGTSSVVREVRIFGFVHDMTLKGLYRLYLYSDQAMTELLLDTGWEKAWPPPYSYDGRSWFTPGFWNGQYTSEEIAGQIPFLPILLDKNYHVRTWRLELQDDNHPNGQVAVRFFGPAAGYQPSAGVAVGADFGYKSYTESKKLRGGLRRHDVLPPSYEFEGVLSYLPIDETFNKPAEIIRQYGEHTPFIWIPYPTHPTRWLKSAKIVNNMGGQRITHITHDRCNIPLALEEYKG